MFYRSSIDIYNMLIKIQESTFLFLSYKGVCLIFLPHYIFIFYWNSFFLNTVYIPNFLFIKILHVQLKIYSYRNDIKINQLNFLLIVGFPVTRKPALSIFVSSFLKVLHLPFLPSLYYDAVLARRTYIFL